MKKILLVSHIMTLGGTEKALLGLLDALQEYPVQVELLLLQKGGALESEIPNNVKVTYFPDFDNIKDVIENPPHRTIVDMAKKGRFSAAVGHFATYMKIKKTGSWHHNYISLLKKYRHPEHYDIAVAFAGPSDFISYLVAKKINADKKVQWIHFDVEKMIFDFSFGKQYYPLFDRVFCVSDNAKAVFLKRFPEMESRTETMHNIVSEPLIIKEAEQGDSYNDGYTGTRILTVGRLSHEKGQFMIPSAAKMLADKGYEFKWYIVGDGAEKNKIETEIIRLGLQKHVVVIGATKNPYRYMRDCDIYMQPSLHEGYGLTVHEAKIFNKPIVVTDFASASNLVQHKKTGLICDINAESIAEALGELLCNPDLQQTFSKNTSLENKDTSQEIEKLFRI